MNACITLLGISLKIAALTRYTRQGASSRMRFIQYFPVHERHRSTVHHENLFPDNYIQSLQSGRAKRYMTIPALMRRIRALFAARNLNAIWVEKDALPWLPAMLETKLISTDVPLVLDYGDAVFHQYDMHPNPVVRQILRGKHQALIS